MESAALVAGLKMKEVATRDAVWTNCTLLNADSVGVVFEVHRTVSEGGTIENVVSRVLIPWSNVRHVVLVEEHT
jgi:hypothetical protein